MRYVVCCEQGRVNPPGGLRAKKKEQWAPSNPLLVVFLSNPNSFRNMHHVIFDTRQVIIQHQPDLISVHQMTRDPQTRNKVWFVMMSRGFLLSSLPHPLCSQTNGGVFYFISQREVVVVVSFSFVTSASVSCLLNLWSMTVTAVRLQAQTITAAPEPLITPLQNFILGGKKAFCILIWRWWPDPPL